MWQLVSGAVSNAWSTTEASDLASQAGSTTLDSIWTGVKNLFTQDEIAVELQEIITTPLLAAPPPEVLREVPRLLSANFDEALDAEDMDFLSSNFGGGGGDGAGEMDEAFDFLLSEWDETPDVIEAPEFMSYEYVEDLAVRELAIDEEFAPSLVQIEMMNMELPELAGAAFEETMAAGEIASVLADLPELLVPMEVDLGPLEAAIGGGVAAALGAASWVGLAAATGIAAIAVGIIFAAWGLARFVIAEEEKNTIHKWKLRGNWVKKGTIGWIMLDKLFYPFIVVEVVGDDLWLDLYKIRFLDIFRIAHEMEVDLSDENIVVTFMGPFENARIEQFVSLTTYIKDKRLRDGSPGMKVWPYVYQIDKNGTIIVPFYKKFKLGTVIRMKKNKKIGYISRLPSLLNPVYTVTGNSGDKWSALPSQFDYFDQTDFPQNRDANEEWFTTDAQKGDPWIDFDGNTVQVGDTIVTLDDPDGEYPATVTYLDDDGRVAVDYGHDAATYPANFVRVVKAPDEAPDEAPTMEDVMRRWGGMFPAKDPEPEKDPEPVTPFTVDRYEDRTPVYDKNNTELFPGDEVFYNDGVHRIERTYADIYTDVEYVDLDSSLFYQIRATSLVKYVPYVEDDIATDSEVDVPDPDPVPPNKVDDADLDFFNQVAGGTLPPVKKAIWDTVVDPVGDPVVPDPVVVDPVVPVVPPVVPDPVVVPDPEPDSEPEPDPMEPDSEPEYVKVSLPLEPDIKSHFTSTRRRLVELKEGQMHNPNIPDDLAWDWEASWQKYGDFIMGTLGVGFRNTYDARNPEGELYMRGKANPTPRHISLAKIEDRGRGWGKPSWRKFTRGLGKEEPTGQLEFYQDYNGALFRALSDKLFDEEQFQNAMNFFMVPTVPRIIQVTSQVPRELLEERLTQLESAEELFENLNIVSFADLPPQFALEKETIQNALDGNFVGEEGNNLPPDPNDPPALPDDPGPEFVQGNDVVMVNAEGGEEPMSDDEPKKGAGEAEPIYRTKDEILMLVKKFAIPNDEFPRSSKPPSVTPEEFEAYKATNKTKGKWARCFFCDYFPFHASSFFKHLASRRHNTLINSALVEAQGSDSGLYYKAALEAHLDKERQNAVRQKKQSTPLPASPTGTDEDFDFQTPPMAPIKLEEITDDDYDSDDSLDLMGPPGPPPIPIDTPWYENFDALGAGIALLDKHTLGYETAVKTTGGMSNVSFKISQFYMNYYSQDIAEILDPAPFGVNVNFDVQPQNLKDALRRHWDDEGLGEVLQALQLEAIGAVLDDKRQVLRDENSEEATNLLDQLNATWKNIEITAPTQNRARMRTFIREILGLIRNVDLVRPDMGGGGVMEARDLDLDLDVRLDSPRPVKRRRTDSPRPAKRRRTEVPAEPSPPPPPPSEPSEPTFKTNDWVGPIIAAAILTLFAYILAGPETPSHRIRA